MMIVRAAVALVALGAASAWGYALYHWVKALGHRRPEISLSTLLLHGAKSFDPESFTEAGQVHRRAFVRGFGAFFAFVFLAVALSLFAIEPG